MTGMRWSMVPCVRNIGNKYKCWLPAFVDHSGLGTQTACFLLQLQLRQADPHERASGREARDESADVILAPCIGPIGRHSSTSGSLRHSQA